MPTKNEAPEVAAHQSVYAALKDLDLETRRRVLASVLALLGMSEVTAISEASKMGSVQEFKPSPQPAVSSRPISVIELMQEKNPRTNEERIALFAYYREKYEGYQRFARRDLEPYFAKAKLAPAANYDRDFVKVVKRGWIHEDGSDSYLTSKGLEAVESDFPGETKRVTAASGAKPKGAKGKSRKTTQKRK
jgi:hypothetical protein